MDDAAEHGAVRLLLADEGDDVLGGQRLEIQAVGGVVIGADGFRVAVHHNGFEPGLAQGVGGVDAAIVELDALADAVGAAAEDDDLLPVGGLALAGGLAVAAFIGGIHVGRGRAELGGAGVDALVDRLHAEPGAEGGDVRFGLAGQDGEAVVGKAESFQAAQRSGVGGQAGGGDEALGVDDAGELAQEPGIEFAGVVDFFDREAGAEGLGGP